MNLEEFLERNRISVEDWEKANISFEELMTIDNDYRQQLSHLNESAEFLAKVLQKCKHVHSVRWRVKEPEHVLEKIVRKKANGSEKYKDVSVNNYSEMITDLVGVRVLHLFKHEWLDIHDYIKTCWVPVEDVIAYIREGDEGTVVESYGENSCKVEVHPAGYRSIHYIISTQPTLRKIYSEIQVRTIFEEGWSEIDHKVRYPNFMDNKLVSYFLTIFNRMSGSADEMGTFVNDLVADIKWKELQLDLKQKEQEEHLQKIETLAQELSEERSANKTKDSNLDKLKKEISILRKNSIQIPDVGLLNSRLADIEKMTSLSREALKYSDIAKLNEEQMNAVRLSNVDLFSSAYKDAIDKISNSRKMNFDKDYFSHLKEGKNNDILFKIKKNKNDKEE
ncbi:RelA/SpoT domain-containing protein [Vibrio vulnificus]|uniref:RelA/SpoT domain-containing protein n=1 Tax=Vibrio vulnificus TaxID=672 RepID=UPI001CCADD6F|nr:RelA/SpoT domain-containing protein [Vibrio vulnificus]MCA0768026.1 RelA/SpoT domain-containing protein [Vibrio vulnificus]MDT8826810.1 RelA/SpoT domain-containing protein [Vibrio vulnificus]MDT9658915.1 RelA/SpoT domain-containing protein [Vibrio vulnificus]HDY7697858.1 RelA/SpoT domain-containing protein [Vibrio vulnificus]HDY8053211.1 RelA/SpoT domain-containing protein [Vibrio vulnificus]